MTTLFPSISDPALRPFIVPFGRMMPAYGRACEAVVFLAMRRSSSEVAARRLAQGTADLPQRMRRLFRDGSDAETLRVIDAATRRFSEIAGERHALVHGEWWFDPFDGGRLRVRRHRGGEASHIEHISATLIEGWAVDLDRIADDLDHVAWSISRGDDVPSAVEA